MTINPLNKSCHSIAFDCLQTRSRITGADKTNWKDIIDLIYIVVAETLSLKPLGSSQHYHAEEFKGGP